MLLGYWYAVELKAFAKRVGIPFYSKLRKDEIEKAIKTFLRTGKVKTPTTRSLVQSGVKDVERGLSVRLPVVNYTSNRETKDFIVREALKLAPDLKRKTGARYRLNRWREDALTKGKRITYGDLVKKYVELNQFEGKFRQVPSGRYINFLSDYLAKENNATKEQAIAAWRELKKMDIPKNYVSWQKAARGSAR